MYCTTQGLISHCQRHLPVNKTGAKWRHNWASRVMRKETQDAHCHFLPRSRHINNTCYKVAPTQKTWWIDDESYESDSRFSPILCKQCDRDRSQYLMEDSSSSFHRPTEGRHLLYLFQQPLNYSLISPVHRYMWPQSLGAMFSKLLWQSKGNYETPGVSLSISQRPPPLRILHPLRRVQSYVFCALQEKNRNRMLTSLSHSQCKAPFFTIWQHTRRGMNQGVVAVYRHHTRSRMSYL